MQYLVTQITGTEPSKFPGSNKYKFYVEGYANELSAFSKFPIEIGQRINGYIEQKGNWHNFKFGVQPPAASPASSSSDWGAKAHNTLELKIIPMLQKMHGDIDQIRRYVIGEEELKGPDPLKPPFQMPDFGEGKDGTDIGF